MSEANCQARLAYSKQLLKKIFTQWH